MCFNSSLLKYGGDIAVGAMTILTNVMQFAMLPLQGLGQGAQPIISYNYGAKASIIVAVMRKFILLLPLIFILPHILTGNETIAVYLAEPIADFLAVTFTIFLFRAQFKKALSSLIDINVTK